MHVCVDSDANMQGLTRGTLSKVLGRVLDSMGEAVTSTKTGHWFTKGYWVGVQVRISPTGLRRVLAQALALYEDTVSEPSLRCPLPANEL